MLGHAIRAARIAHGLTQVETAKRCRKTRLWLYKIEQGLIVPSLDSARTLVQVLHLDPGLFIGEPPPEEPPLC
jgi:transcriptional regulator with XRE-family HTH domain